MKKKSKQQEYLEQYVGLKAEIASIEKIMDESLRESLQSRIDANKQKMDEIQRAVESIEDPLQRSVLRAKYIDCKAGDLTIWSDVALLIYGRDDESKMQAIYRLHGRALQSLGVIIEDTEKSHP